MKNYILIVIMVAVCFGQRFPGRNLLEDLDDVNITVPDSGAVLLYDGEYWVDSVLVISIDSVLHSTYSDSALFADSAGYPDSAQVVAWAGGGGGIDSTFWKFRITDTADTSLETSGRWGLIRYGNITYGNADSTHVNLGVVCTTGQSGRNKKYDAVLSGYLNVAKGGTGSLLTLPSVVCGGKENQAIGYSSVIVGGNGNVANNNVCIVVGGSNNTSSGFASIVVGGSRNKSSGSQSVVLGGVYNAARGTGSIVFGQSEQTPDSCQALGVRGLSFGVGNYAGDAAVDTGAYVFGGLRNQVTGRNSLSLMSDSSVVSGNFSALIFGSNDTLALDSTIQIGGKQTKSVRIPTRSYTERAFVDSIYHAVGGFEDKEATVSITQNVWSMVTDSAGTLWEGTDIDGIDFDGDTIIFLHTGDYAGNVSMSYAGQNGNVYKFRVYDVTSATAGSYKVAHTATGTTNISSVSFPFYIRATAGDRMIMQVTNIDSNASAVFWHGAFYMYLLHN